MSAEKMPIILKSALFVAEKSQVIYDFNVNTFLILGKTNYSTFDDFGTTVKNASTLGGHDHSQRFFKESQYLG